jgi:alkanesulfonate monooxygenase SsuD/methylene tetrahydromethanopterin reductase-like flavin-dependent oxidoreductase (luciferase family)
MSDTRATEPGPHLSGLGVILPGLDEIPAAVHVQIARTAEDAGFDAVGAGEVAGPEAFALLGAMSQGTRRIALGTTVISTFTRSPALAAMAFSTLHDLAPGRVFAGVGSGSAGINSWHNVAFDKPLAKAREFVIGLRAALGGERLGSGVGELGTSSFRVMPPAVRHVPIVLAAMHPGMLRLAGAIGDGVFLAFCPVIELPNRIALVREGARAVGRDPAEVKVVVTMDAYAGDHYDEVLVRLSRFVLQYSVLPTHRESIKGSFPDIDSATEAWQAGDRKAALACVDEATVKRICAIGTGSDVLGRVRELQAAGADLVTLHTLGRGVGDELSAIQTITAVGAAMDG